MREGIYEPGIGSSVRLEVADNWERESGRCGLDLRERNMIYATIDPSDLDFLGEITA